MADLSLVVTRRWGPVVVGLGYQPMDTTGLDLSTISDSDCMFVAVAHCMSFRVASTTGYAEYFERRCVVTRVGGVYTRSNPNVKGLPSADNDYGPTISTQDVAGAHSPIANQIDFDFSLSVSTLRVVASRISAGPDVKCRAYLQVMLNDV